MSKSIELTDIVGEMGVVQKYIYVLDFLFTMLMGWQSVMMPFLAPPLEKTCITKADKELMDNNTSHTNCSEWIFHHPEFVYTLSEKLDLVGDRAWLASFATTFFMLGGMVSNLLGGQMSDKLGRRKTVFVMVPPYVASQLLVLFPYNYLMLAIGQFLMGGACLAIGSTLFVLLIETVGSKYRSYLGVSLELSFLTGNILLVGSAWFLRNWFYVQIVNTILTFLIILGVGYIPESPSWLITNDRLVEAHDVIENIVQRNSRKVEYLEAKVFELVEQLKVQTKGEEVKKYSFLHLFKTMNIRKRTYLLNFVSFAVGLCFYGLSLNVNLLGENVFLDFFLSSVLGYPSLLMAILMVRYSSLRNAFATCLVCAGVVCALYAFSETITGLRTAVVVTGRFFISPTLPMAITFTSELYPTVVRGIGVGLACFTLRVSSSLAPFAKEVSQSSSQLAPMLIFGGAGVAGGLALLLLPETKDKSVPDTIEELEGCDQSKEMNLFKRYMEKEPISNVTLRSYTKSPT